jgi:hypothetical protein
LERGHGTCVQAALVPTTTGEDGGLDSGSLLLESVFDIDPPARLEEAHAVFAAVPVTKQFKESPETGHESSLARFPAE